MVRKIHTLGTKRSPLLSFHSPSFKEEVLNGNNLVISKLRVFGCTEYFHILKQFGKIFNAEKLLGIDRRILKNGLS